MRCDPFIFLPQILKWVCFTVLYRHILINMFTTIINRKILRVYVGGVGMCICGRKISKMIHPVVLQYIKVNTP